jgi:hypothetical protein
MLTIITPCSRPENLKEMRESIDFDRIDKWIIVHDTTKTGGIFSTSLNHPKIIELGHMSPPGTCSGNSQRNLALSLFHGGMVYFLDDDNIIHPNFWKLVPMFKEDRFYTFDQQRWDEFVATPGGIFKGDTPRLQKIDTAQYVIPFSMRSHWKEDDYKADGLFIEDVFTRNKSAHVYIPIVASYYNYLRRPTS